jgi:hypothetical protein
VKCLRPGLFLVYFACSVSVGVVLHGALSAF